MKSRLSENLKALRERIGHTQAEIAAFVGITDKNWSSYERGITEPNIETLIKIANIFGVSTDSLITIDARMITVPHARDDYRAYQEARAPKNEAREPKEKYSYAPKVIVSGAQGNDKVAMVSADARPGYRSGYCDPEFIQALPSYQMPGISGGTFRMFEIVGEGMVPTLYAGDHVVGRCVESFAEICDDAIYVVLKKHDGIVVGRATTHTHNKLVLHRDNLQHPDANLAMSIAPKDALEIWYVTSYLSSHVRKSGTLHSRLTDLESRLTLLEDKERL